MTCPPPTFRRTRRRRYRVGLRDAGPALYGGPMRADTVSRLLVPVAASIAAIAVVTAAIGVLDDHVPVLSLGVLYVFAVLPVAVLWGSWFALAVAVACMIAFNFFFRPPTHPSSRREGASWLALAVYSAPAFLVREFPASAPRRAALAEQRERES